MSRPNHRPNRGDRAAPSAADPAAPAAAVGTASEISSEDTGMATADGAAGWGSINEFVHSLPQVPEGFEVSPEVVQAVVAEARAAHASSEYETLMGDDEELQSDSEAIVREIEWLQYENEQLQSKIESLEYKVQQLEYENQHLRRENQQVRRGHESRTQLEHWRAISRHNSRVSDRLQRQLGGESPFEDDDREDGGCEKGV